MKNQRTKLVVIDNHTLGYILPESKYAGVLASSVIKGSSRVSFISSFDPILIEQKDIRLASEKDFNDFRVSFKGYDNESEYEFQK